MFGPRVIEAIERGETEAKPTGAMRAVIDDGVPDLIGGRVIDAFSSTRAAPASEPPVLDRAARERLQRAMTTGAGVLRSAAASPRPPLVVDEVRSSHAGVPPMPRRPRPATWPTSRTASSPRRPCARRAGARTPAPTSRRSTRRCACASCCDDRRVAEQWCATRSHGRSPRTSGRSATSPPRCSIPASADSPSFVPRKNGVLAGHGVRDRGVRAGRRVGRSCSGEPTTATRSAAGDVIGTVEGAAGVDPHRRAHRAELPLPPQRHRDVDPPLRRRGRRGARQSRPHLGHPQDAAGPARAREGGRARRRRREPPRLAVRDGAREGQPPRPARHQRGGPSRPRALARPLASKSSANGSSR